jgi:hypothetical protein
MIVLDAIVNRLRTSKGPREEGVRRVYIMIVVWREEAPEIVRRVGLGSRPDLD